MASKTKRTIAQSTTGKCIAREPLLYGSKACDAPLDKNHPVSDLCKQHRRLIAPHQIVNGVFYVGRDDDNG